MFSSHGIYVMLSFQRSTWHFARKIITTWSLGERREIIGLHMTANINTRTTRTQKTTETGL